MNMNEMMRNAASQKREQQEPSNTLRDELQTMNERLAQIEAKGDQGELMKQLASLNEHLAAMKASGQRPLREELQDLNRQIAALGKSRQNQDVSSVAEQLLKAAKQKEERASETLKENEEHTRQARLALSGAEEVARKVQRAAQTIEGAPKALTAASKSARAEITRSLQFLTLKAAGIGVLIAITTFLAVTLAGVMLLRNQGLSLRIMTEEESNQLIIGEDVYQMFPTWSEEERELWKRLMQGNDQTSETPQSER